MKTLLVFLATWILYGALLVYQSDFSRMNMLEWETERIARQSVSGGIQFFDEESYSEGNMVVDEDAMQQYAQEFLQGETGKNPKIAGGNLTLSLSAHNPEILPEDIQAQVVSAQVVYEEDDFFRLSFLKKNKITKKIYYEVRGF